MEKIKFVEVGPRDGLQNQTESFSLDFRIELIERLVNCGVESLEAGSFVSPKAIPQMQDSEKVFEALKSKAVDLSFLVPNRKGFDRAVTAGVRSIALFTATSEAFVQKNIRMSIDDSMRVFEEISREAKDRKMRIRGYLSTVFGCPYEGRQSVTSAIELTKRLFQMGCDEVSLGDTIGVAHPRQVREFWKDFRSELSVKNVAAHFHDTRGAALANILATLESEVRIFDGSVGGLGGCPYAAGASGNVASEEVIWLLEGLGFETGISLEELLTTAAWLETHLKNPLKSKLYRSAPKHLYYHKV
ncbi:MAG: hydroxymethylglutaryl-CoA lyase [Bradymonadales bacterium]|nr:MAG: hydroxymethylglutaryl-CoA lyase [Bradymonadales bacterium]